MRATSSVSRNFDIAPDGSGFVMIEEDRSGDRAREARLIHGWLDKISHLLPD